MAHYQPPGVCILFGPLLAGLSQAYFAKCIRVQNLCAWLQAWQTLNHAMMATRQRHVALVKCPCFCRHLRCKALLSG